MNKIKNYEEYEEVTRSALEAKKKKNYTLALEHLQRMAQYNNENYKVHEMLSSVLLELGNIDEADKEYRIALKLVEKQKGGRIQVKMATFEEMVGGLREKEELEREYAELKEVIEKDSSDKTSNNLPIQLGIHLMASGEYGKAEELLVRHKELKESKKKNRRG